MDDWPFDEDDAEIPNDGKWAVGARVLYTPQNLAGTVVKPTRNTPRDGYTIRMDRDDYGTIDFNHDTRIIALPEMAEHTDICGLSYCKQCYPTNNEQSRRYESVRMLGRKDRMNDAQLGRLLPAEREIYNAYSLEWRQQEIVRRAHNAGELTEADRTVLTYPQLQEAVQAVRDYQGRAERARLLEAQQRQTAEAIKARATELLLSLLPKKEQKIHRKTGWFHFKGPRSKATYRIHCPQELINGWSNRHMEVLKEGYDPMVDDQDQIIANYCVHSDTYELDARDCAAALMLAFQADEGKMLNKSYIQINRLPHDHPIHEVKRSHAYLENHYNYLQQGYDCIWAKRRLNAMDRRAELQRVDLGATRSRNNFTFEIRHDDNGKGRTIALYVLPTPAVRKRIQEAYEQKKPWMTPFVSKAFADAGWLDTTVERKEAKAEIKPVPEGQALSGFTFTTSTSNVVLTTVA